MFEFVQQNRSNDIKRYSDNNNGLGEGLLLNDVIFMKYKKKQLNKYNLCGKIKWIFLKEK